MPLISVVLPVYNSEKYIEEAVQSILDQTFTDFELLIINDASTDKTLEILSEFNDPRMKIINNSENLKVVKSLNKGINIAQGEFIARMDADDVAYPQRFKKQIEYFNTHPDIDICGSWAHAFGDDNFIFSPYEHHDDIKAALLFLNVIIHPTVIFRKKSLLKHMLIYDELYINAEDYGLWTEAMDKLKLANIPQVLLKYRLHDNNVSVFKNEIPMVIREMNTKAYKTIFRKMGIGYTSSQLEIHLVLGLKKINNLSKKQLTENLNWLQMLVLANNKSRYFKKQSLRNVIIHNLIYLIKKKKRDPIACIKIVKTMISLYNIKDYFEFLQYKLKSKSFFLRHSN